MTHIRTLHIVFGEAGEYEDHEKWIVGIFTDKRKAVKFQKEREVKEANWKEEEHTDHENFDYRWNGPASFVIENYKATID